MLKVNNVSLRFGTRTLFQDVNLEFKDSNCYGIIGANGAGKSTFLKLISGEIETTSGEIIIGKNERISILKQNHNEFNDYTVMDTIIMGDEELYQIIKEKEFLYSKPNFSVEDGIRVAELESRFEEKNGWLLESNISVLLNGLGMDSDCLYRYMRELKDIEKVKILLARALFGEPDILLLDEPTNGLDSKTILWLEDFLMNFKNTVLVVSHDRHFLNSICTHIVDIDYEKITMFVGNYDFWYQSSQLLLKQMKESNKKKEEKIKELEDFIRRFSANASKSKQATSRKKALEKIVLDEIRPSSRRYPYIHFDIEKNLGKEVISLEKINYSCDGKVLLQNVNLTIHPDSKIALIGNNELAKTALLSIIAGVIKPNSGSVSIGSTVKISYFEKDHSKYFKCEKSLFEWLRDFSNNKEESFVRGFLGRMLFSGEEALKNVQVLSGGEKVRAMFSKLMLNQGNILLLDEPTDHLDMEAITALNEACQDYKGALIISTFDQELIETTTNRIIHIKEDGTIKDINMNYEEYMAKYGL